MGTPDSAKIDAGLRDAVKLVILVADDDRAVRTYIQEVLQRRGYRVLQAADGVEALRVAAQHCGPICLLLTDIEMPLLGGLGLQNRLTGQRPEMKTLFMSGSVNTGLPAGTAFLPKPFSAAALARKVGGLAAYKGAA
jgi:CheY-like chemotaxis protein